MILKVELPDDWSKVENPIQEAKEAIAVALFRANEVPVADMPKMSGLGQAEFDSALEKRGLVR